MPPEFNQNRLPKCVLARHCPGMKQFLIAAFTLSVLSACAGTIAPTASGGATPPPSGSYPTGLDNTCDGERFGPLVGQDATALERVLFLGEVRINRPGSLTTQDYRPNRINFQIDSANRIASISCG